MIGQAVPHLKILEKLGQGGSPSDAKLHRHVAISCCMANFSMTPNGCYRLTVK